MGEELTRTRESRFLLRLDKPINYYYYYYYYYYYSNAWDCLEINNTKSNSSAMVSAEKRLVIQTVIAPMRNYLDPFMIRHQNLPYGACILGWK